MSFWLIYQIYTSIVVGHAADMFIGPYMKYMFVGVIPTTFTFVAPNFLLIVHCNVS